MFRSANFEKLLEKATSNLRLEPDWPTIIKLSDLIRQGDVQPKHALASIKKKMFSENPHTAMFGLLVLESCVKNCGTIIYDEVGTAGYMTQLRDLLKASTQDNIRNKVLELIQAWAFAFRNLPKYRAVQDTMNILKAEDYKFPVLKESDAMFAADTAPEWADGDCCHRCRVAFGVVQRKHHCRACGQVFCGQCSSKTCTLPKFGIEKEVRVCDACFTNNSNLKMTKSTPPSGKTEDLPVEYLNSSLAQQNQAPPPRKTEEELREEEELQLALALSQSEAESKKMPGGVSATRVKTYSPLPAARTSSPPVEDVDPELARYLNRSYWENRPQQEEPQHSSPSAPANLSSPMPASNKSANITLEQNGVESEAQLEEFVAALHGQVEIFVNRMKSNSSRGRSITNDSSVQTLFMTITAMHSKLLRYIQQQDDSRVYYEGLQDKLAQVKDARAALNALREEHREKLRREAEIAERQRQMQMAHKLDIMRQKKQEYLQYQRQLALQRIQEQEREMQMRQEQQKQQYLMGSYNPINYMPPGGTYDNHGGVPGSGSMVMPPHLSGYPPNSVPVGYPSQFQPPPGHPGQHVPMMGAPHPTFMMHNPMMIPPSMMVPPGGPPSGQMHSMGQQQPQPPPGQQPQLQQGQPPQQVPMGMPQAVHHGPMSPNSGGQGSAPVTNNQSGPPMMPGPGNQNGPAIMAGAPMMMPPHGLPPQTFQPQPQQMPQSQPQPLPNQQPPPPAQEPPKSAPPETAELISFD